MPHTDRRRTKEFTVYTPKSAKKFPALPRCRQNRRWSVVAQRVIVFYFPWLQGHIAGEAIMKRPSWAVAHWHWRLTKTTSSPPLSPPKMQPQLTYRCALRLNGFAVISKLTPRNCSCILHPTSVSPHSLISMSFLHLYKPRNAFASFYDVPQSALYIWHGRPGCVVCWYLNNIHNTTQRESYRSFRDQSSIQDLHRRSIELYRVGLWFFGIMSLCCLLLFERRSNSESAEIDISAIIMAKKGENGGQSSANKPNVCCLWLYS